MEVWYNVMKILLSKKNNQDWMRGHHKKKWKYKELEKNPPNSEKWKIKHYNSEHLLWCFNINNTWITNYKWIVMLLIFYQFGFWANCLQPNELKTNRSSDQSRACFSVVRTSSWCCFQQSRIWSDLLTQFISNSSTFCSLVCSFFSVLTFPHVSNLKILISGFHLNLHILGTSWGSQLSAFILNFVY